MPRLSESARYLIEHWATYAEMKQVEQQVDETYLTEIADRVAEVAGTWLPDGWEATVDDQDEVTVYPVAAPFGHGRYWSLFASLGPFSLGTLLGRRPDERARVRVGTDLAGSRTEELRKLYQALIVASVALEQPEGCHPPESDEDFAEQSFGGAVPLAVLVSPDELVEHVCTLFRPAVEYAIALSKATLLAGDAQATESLP